MKLDTHFQPAHKKTTPHRILMCSQSGTERGFSEYMPLYQILGSEQG
jgi:hypothetical protein